MKVKYLVPFEDAPGWLENLEIELNDGVLQLTAVKRNDIVLGTVAIPLKKFERMVERMKEDSNADS